MGLTEIEIYGKGRNMTGPLEDIDGNVFAWLFDQERERQNCEFDNEKERYEDDESGSHGEILQEKSEGRQNY